MLALGWAGGVAEVWLASAAVGASVAVTQPAIGVLLLAWTPEERTREIFAWQFIGLNLALAAGGFLGGITVDLATPAGTHPLYVIAAAAAVASAVAVFFAGRGARRTPLDARLERFEALPGGRGSGGVGLRALLRVRAIRWLLAITALLMLACYAQYESGLPAYALSSVHVSTKLLGVGVAVNALLVAGLTGPVVAITRKHSPTTLLACCAGIWILCWVVFGAPLLASGIGSGAVLIGYAGISFGETMLAPVLNPFAASLAPDGALGRTLSAVSGATTLATAIGPAISGVLIAFHLPAGFIALQIACCLGAILLSLRLGRILAKPSIAAALTEAGPTVGRQVAPAR
jgi:MFS family permease